MKNLINFISSLLMLLFILGLPMSLNSQCKPMKVVGNSKYYGGNYMFGQHLAFVVTEYPNKRKSLKISMKIEVDLAGSIPGAADVVLDNPSGGIMFVFKNKTGFTLFSDGYVVPGIIGDDNMTILFSAWLDYNQATLFYNYDIVGIKMDFGPGINLTWYKSSLKKWKKIRKRFKCVDLEEIFTLEDDIDYQKYDKDSIVLPSNYSDEFSGYWLKDGHPSGQNILQIMKVVDGKCGFVNNGITISQSGSYSFVSNELFIKRRTNGREFIQKYKIKKFAKDYLVLFNEITFEDEDYYRMTDDDIMNYTRSLISDEDIPTGDINTALVHIEDYSDEIVGEWYYKEMPVYHITYKKNGRFSSSVKGNIIYSGSWNVDGINYYDKYRHKGKREESKMEIKEFLKDKITFKDEKGKEGIFFRLNN